MADREHEQHLDELAGIRPPHPTCIETTPFGKVAERSWMCGPDCPRPGMAGYVRQHRPGWHDEDAPRISLDFDGNDADAAYTELGRLRAAGDPERDARREAYADRERRKAARALDRFLDTWFRDKTDPVNAQFEVTYAAGNHFVEAVGDYVLSRLGQCAHDCGYTDCPEHGTSPMQQKRDYGASLDTEDATVLPSMHDDRKAHRDAN